MFYHYSQNNSGGSFDIDKERGITVSVYVEADTPEQADSRAEFIGLYFSGVAEGRDCDCCGDRWYEASSWDKTALEEIPVASDNMWSTAGEGIVIHYKDGRVEWR